MYMYIGHICLHTVHVHNDVHTLVHVHQHSGLVVAIMCPYFSPQMIPIDKYEAQSMCGKYLPITPNGHDIPLTFGNRVDYFNKALEFRLHELDKQV